MFKSECQLQLAIDVHVIIRVSYNLKMISHTINFPTEDEIT